LVISLGYEKDTSRDKKSDEVLWQELLRVCTLLDKIPTQRDFTWNSTTPDTTLRKRHSNSWAKVLINFKLWLKVNKADSKFIALLPDKVVETKPKIHINKPSIDHIYEPTGDTILGPPMNFRGLIYEPINEDGVIFLFAKISEDIGFYIEGIKKGFPDCVGTRRIGNNRWSRVLIEFEYKAKNFLDHSHDSSKCDVIICWENDWPDCPIEVISLKDKVEDLRIKESI